ncbi:MAG: YIP1 family protein [candidate division KSB1 bacterium]|nr:YIP1 family protein [candidate division KSB1 bacterium]MDZ7304509.1 YIP1 family protein [candidate division KSB1 bacterium]MDZ7313889.1 YIP1 family protein [candidate division KSB1 bacterium]
MPWEDRERLGFLPAFSQTWSDSVFHPVEFFRRLPKSGNVGSALLYAILIGVTGGILSLFWQYLFWDSWSSLPELERMLGQEISRDLLGFVALLIPISTVIFVFIASVIYHVCLVITGSSRHGFEATLRGFCYSYGPYLFVLVPMCGGLIALIWQYILMVIAWRELHESTTGRVLLAVFLPLLLCCGAILVFAWSLAGWLSRFAQ